MDNQHRTGWSAPQSETAEVTPLSDKSNQPSMISTESFDELAHSLAGLALKAAKLDRVDLTIYEDGNDKVVAADTGGNPRVSEGDQGSSSKPKGPGSAASSTPTTSGTSEASTAKAAALRAQLEAAKLRKQLIKAEVDEAELTAQIAAEQEAEYQESASVSSIGERSEGNLRNERGLGPAAAGASVSAPCTPARGERGKKSVPDGSPLVLSRSMGSRDFVDPLWRAMRSLPEPPLDSFPLEREGRMAGAGRGGN